MWPVVRYDAQAKSLIAAGSDMDGPVLWSATTVKVHHDEQEETLNLRARAIKNAGPAKWVDWQDFKIVIDSSNRATITKTNPVGKFVYQGRAVKISTFQQ